MSRRQSQDCLSDLELDRWLAGESNAERAAAEIARWTLHLDSCLPCRQRHAELSEERRRLSLDWPAFAGAGRPSEELTKARSPWPKRSWAAAALVASALATAGALLFMGERPHPPASALDAALGGAAADTRIKGNRASLGWVVRRGTHVFAGGPDRALRGGDALRFTISSPAPVYVAVLGLDAAGQLSVYYSDGDRLARVEAGQEQPLPGAIELDRTPQGERLYGVFCASAVPLSRVTAAIERSPDAPALPERCSFERQSLLAESP